MALKLLGRLLLLHGMELLHSLSLLGLHRIWSGKAATHLRGHWRRRHESRMRHTTSTTEIRLTESTTTTTTEGSGSRRWLQKTLLAARLGLHLLQSEWRHRARMPSGQCWRAEHHTAMSRLTKGGHASAMSELHLTAVTLH
jgi:hypothetical protein